jgi:transcriptional regulator with XRE-family HTH domain
MKSGSALVTNYKGSILMYMAIKLGEKIKAIRKQRNISQEVLAEYLGVTFQAVSKWENETAIPDVTLIPAACFYGTSASGTTNQPARNGYKSRRERCNTSLRLCFYLYLRHCHQPGR